MQIKGRGKPWASVAFLLCLFGMLDFAQSMRGQQDPAAGKPSTSTAQGGAAPQKDAAAAAEEELQKPFRTQWPA